MKLFRPASVLALMTLTACLTACTHTWVDTKHQQPANFATWVDTPQGTAYNLQPGDDLSVVLPFNGELNYKGRVSPDGTFTMPFVGTVPAGGRTAAQLAYTINKTLATNGITANAFATVSIVQSTAHVFVGGQVAKPGEIPLTAGMSVMQAVTAAQGLLDTARTGEIVLIRRSPDGRPMLRTIDLDKLTQQGDPAQDIVLQSSDTIFVPKSSIAEVDQWVDQYMNKALPFSRTLNYDITGSRAY